MARPRLLSEELLRGLERLTLRTRAASGLSPIGEHPGRLRSSSAEFAESRAYASGDDFRRIDWNVFARLDVLHVKLNEARETASLSLLVDCSESMHFGQPSKALLAAEIARGLAYIGLNQLDDVRVFGFGAALLARSPAYRGRGHSHEVFSFVDSLPRADDSNVEYALDAFIAQTTNPGVVIVLSDLLSASDTPRALRRLVSMGFEVTVMHLLSQDEVNPDLDGDLELIDSETGERQPVSLTPAAIDDYRLDLEHWRQETAADCLRLGVRYVPVLNDQPLNVLFLVTFRQYGLVD
jgi:uncharacterized protein (DUF58 family)